VGRCAGHFSVDVEHQRIVGEDGDVAAATGRNARIVYVRAVHEPEHHPQHARPGHPVDHAEVQFAVVKLGLRGNPERTPFPRTVAGYGHHDLALRRLAIHRDRRPHGLHRTHDGLKHHGDVERHPPHIAKPARTHSNPGVKTDTHCVVEIATVLVVHHHVSDVDEARLAAHDLLARFANVRGGAGGHAEIVPRAGWNAAKYGRRHPLACGHHAVDDLVGSAIAPHSNHCRAAVGHCTTGKIHRLTGHAGGHDLEIGAEFSETLPDQRQDPARVTAASHRVQDDTDGRHTSPPGGLAEGRVRRRRMIPQEPAVPKSGAGRPQALPSRAPWVLPSPVRRGGPEGVP